jgi:hypothetical protein
MKINVDPALSPAEQRRMYPLTRHAPVYGEDGKLLGFNGETAADTYDDAELRAELELVRPTAAAESELDIPSLASGLAEILESPSRFKDERVMIMLEDLVDRRHAMALYKSFANDHVEVHARLLDVCLNSFALTPREGFRKAMVTSADALLSAMPEPARAKRLVEILRAGGTKRKELFASIQEWKPSMFEDMVEAAVDLL